MKSFSVSAGSKGILLVAVLLGAAQFALASDIAGTVYDNRRNALIDVNVELLNENRSLLRYTRTDGIGRYMFDGLTDGNYYVRVMPFRYDFDEESQYIEIRTISQVSNRPGYTREQRDFYLTPRKGTLAEAQAAVIFAQEVPQEAQKLFEAGQKALKKGKPDEALLSFQGAVKLFPDYFMANHYLGAIYFEKKDYEHAAPPLIKAVEVNDKSSVTYFYLGSTLLKLNYYKAAVVALKASAVMTPASVAVHTTLGMAQRQLREYRDAEESLLKAKKLMKTESPEIYKELAALYGETKQFDKGADSLEHMLKAGTYSEADAAKIREQIKVWKEMSAKQPAPKAS